MWVYVHLRRIFRHCPILPWIPPYPFNPSSSDRGRDIYSLRTNVSNLNTFISIDKLWLHSFISLYNIFRRPKFIAICWQFFFFASKIDREFCCKHACSLCGMGSESFSEYWVILYMYMFAHILHSLC